MQSKSEKKDYNYSEDYYIKNGISGFESIDRMDHRAILKAVEFKENDCVLEIGCGLGILLSLLKAKNKYGVESNEFAINKCKEKGINARFHDDVYNLPFDDNFFDVVIMNESIEHIHNVDRLTKEVKRILKGEGKFIITTPNKGFLVKNLSESHCSEMTFNELEKLMSSNDFEIVAHTVSGINIWDYIGRKAIYPLAKFLVRKNMLIGTIKKTKDKADHSKMLNFRDYLTSFGTQQLLIAKNNK